jgi:hypothetical protein
MVEGDNLEDVFANRTVVKGHKRVCGERTPGVLAEPVGVLEITRLRQIPFVPASEDHSKLSGRNGFPEVLIRPDGDPWRIVIDIRLKYGRTPVGDRPNASARILQNGVSRAYRQAIRHAV